MELDTSLGNLLRRAHRGINKLLEEMIEPYGVTIGMWYFLRALWEKDGITQSELAERIGVMGPTTVSALDRIERSGWIKRVRSEEDRRKVMVTLTPKGRALEKKLLPVAQKAAGTATSALSSPQQKKLVVLLGILVATIEADDG